MADNRARLYGQNGPGLTRNYAYNSSSNNNSNNNGLSREARELNNLIHRIYMVVDPKVRVGNRKP